MPKLKNQSGQVIIILLLIVLVVLTMVITVNRRTVTDVLTSTQNDQSSKAFSAAEAGIELAKQGTAPTSAIELGNQASVTVTSSRLYPDKTFLTDPDPVASILEYPPIGKDTIAHFWLRDPNNSFSGDINYNTRLDLFFGSPEIFAGLTGNEEKPAIEVKIISQSSGVFRFSKTLFFDSNSSRVSINNFRPATCTGYIAQARTGFSPNSSSEYQCRVTLDTLPSGEVPILLRVRLLYSSQKHRIALQPFSASLPPQARIYQSIGTAGKSTKTIQVFSITKVPPFFFDFAVFSTADIKK
jgi:hypothetical protein